MIDVLLAKDIEPLFNDPSKKIGLFLSFEGKRIYGIDNSTADAWTEEFDTVDKAIIWLRNTTAVEKVANYRVKIKEHVSNNYYSLPAAVALANHLNNITGIVVDILEAY